MKKYILNGVPYEVSPEDEQMFIDKGAELVEDDASGNQIDPANSATVGSDSSTETNLSQDNQINTESNLADTSLVSLKGVNYEVPNDEVEEFLNSNEGATKVDSNTNNYDPTAKGEWSRLMNEYDEEVNKDKNFFERMGPGNILDTYMGAYKKYSEEHGLEAFKEGFRKSAFGEFFGLNPNTESSFETEISGPELTEEEIQAYKEEGGLLTGPEKSLANSLNKRFEGQITVEEALAGKNAISMQIGGGDEAIFRLNAGSEFVSAMVGGEAKLTPDALFGLKRKGTNLSYYDNPNVNTDIINHIHRKTNKKDALVIDGQISDIFKDIIESELDSTTDDMAEFAHALDVKQGINTNGSYLDRVVTNIYDGKSKNTASDLDEVDPQNSSLVTKQGVNMDGFITINGRKFSYEYLWDNRKDFADINKQQRKIAQTYQTTNKLNNKDNTYIQGLFEILQNESLSNKQRQLAKEKLISSNETVMNHMSATVIAPHFGIEDGRIKSINNVIELYEGGKTTDAQGQFINITDENRAEVDAKIQRLKDEKNQIIKDNNYEDLYNEEGKFIGMSRFNWVEDPNDPNQQIRLDKYGNYMEGEENRRPTEKYDDEDFIMTLANNDREWLGGELRDSYFGYIAAMKLAHENIDKVGEKINWSKKLMSFLHKDSYEVDKEMLARAYEAGDVVFDGKALTGLAGGTRIAEGFNEARSRFIALAKAYDLNINLLEANKDSWGKSALNSLSKNFTGSNLDLRAFGLSEDTYSENTTTELADVFEGVLSQEFDIDDVKNVTSRGRGNAGRHIADLTSQTVTGLLPLLAELYVFKKMGGLKALNTGVRGVQNTVKASGRLRQFSTSKVATKLRLNTIARKLSNVTNSRTFSKVNQGIIIPAIVTPMEWSIAEYAGEQLLSDGSGQFEAHTFSIDEESGKVETNFIFPATMAIGGGAFAMGSKWFKNKVVFPHIKKQINAGKSTYLTNYLGLLDKAAGKPIIGGGVTAARSLTNIGAGSLGKGLTATGLLQLSSYAEYTNKRIKAGYFWPWENVNKNSIKGKQLIEEWDSFNNWDHVIATTVAMMTIGVPKSMKSNWKTIKSDWAKVNENSPSAIKAAETINIKKLQKKQNKNGTWDKDKIAESAKKEIDNARKEIKRIIKEASPKDRQRLIKEQTNKIKSIAEAAKELHRRNDIIEIKTGLRGKQERDKALLKSFTNAKRILSGNFDVEEIESIYEMRENEFVEFLSDNNVSTSTTTGKKMMEMFNFIKRQQVIGQGQYKLKGKELSKYILEMYDNAIIDGRIEALKDKMKKDKNPLEKEDIKEQIKELEQKSKDLRLASSAIIKQYRRDHKDRLDKEQKAEKEHIEKEKKFDEYNIVKGSGKGTQKRTGEENFKKVVNEEHRKSEEKLINEKLEKGEITKKEANRQKKQIKDIYRQGMSAFVSADRKRIFINYDFSLKHGLLGEGTHEINHVLLGEYLKETSTIYGNKSYNKSALEKLKNSKNKADRDLHKEITSKGTEREVVSKGGMIIIDHMLSQLTSVERKILQDKIDLNYKYNFLGKDINLKNVFETNPETGKKVENLPETYYEEYITVLGTAIKNKEISPTLDLGHRVGKALFPALKAFNKNLYKFDINQTNSAKAGKDLLSFITELNTKGLTTNVLDVIRRTTGPIVAGTKTSASSIRKDLEQIKTAETNEKLYQDIVDYANKNNIPLGRSSKSKQSNIKTFDAVTPEMRTALVENNKWIAKWLSTHAELGGKGVQGGGAYSEKVRKRLEDDFVLELENLARTFDPSKNTSFPAYVLQGSAGGQKLAIMKKRYAGIIDRLVKETSAVSLNKPVGEKGTVGDLIEGQVDSSVGKFETQDVSIGRRKRQRIVKSVEVAGRSKLRNEIGLSDKEMSSAEKTELIEKIKRNMRISKTPFEKGFIKSITDATENSHFDILNKKLDNAAIKRNKNIILNSMPTSELIKLGAQKSGGNPFVKAHTNPYVKTGRWSTEAHIKEFMGIKPDNGVFTVNTSKKNLLPEMRNLYDVWSKLPVEIQKSSPEFIEWNRIKGNGIPKIYERLEVNNGVWEAYVDAATLGKRQVSEKSGTKTNNRTAILKRLSTSLSKDAMPEILKDTEFLENYVSQKDLNTMQAKALVNKYLNDISRESGLVFSTRKDLLSPAEIGGEKMKRVIDVINTTRGDAHKVFDLSADKLSYPPPRKAEYKDLTLQQAELVWDMFTKMDKQGQQLIHNLDHALKQVFKGNVVTPPGQQTSKGNEVRVGNLLAKGFVDSNGKKQMHITMAEGFGTEKGGLADVPAIILKDWASKRGLEGIEMNIEVKMSEKGAQYGSLSGYVVDAAKGIVTTKNPKSGVDKLDFYTPENKAKILELLKGVIEGHKVMKEMLNELGNSDLGVLFSPLEIKQLKEYKNPGDLYPEIAHDIITEKTSGQKSILTGMESNGKFTESYLVDHYINEYIGMGKKPITHFTIADNLYHLGKNKLGTTTSMLEGQVEGGWRGFKVSQTKTVNGVTSKTGSVSISFRFHGFQPKFKGESIGKISTPMDRAKLLSPQAIMALKSKIIKDNLKLKNDARKTSLTMSMRNEKRGLSTFDFDETVGISENFIIAKKDGKTKRIESDKWPFVGDKMIAEGWKMDFTDFDKVTKGKPGPLFDKMKNQIAKYGPDNVFILTARGPGSQPAIHAWLKANGINIPLKNITGLGQSSGNAKALWMLEKFKEGYNDMYFVDDALPNVKAVKKVLDQLDIKSKVVQAKIHQKVGKFIVDTSTKEGKQFIEDYKNIPTVRSSEFRKIGNWIVDTTTKEGKQFVKDFDNTPTVSSSEPGRVTKPSELKFSKNIDAEFNDMMHRRYGTYGSNPRDRVSSADAKILGQQKNHFDFFVPASAEDFRGLMYKFLGTGKQGNADALFLKEKLFTPYAQAYKVLNDKKQRMSTEYKELKKISKDINLKEKITGTNFNVDLAIRTYLWEKAGFEIPGMEAKEKQKLLDFVEKNPKLINFAETLSNITRLEKGYVEPTEYWMLENIGSDLKGVTETVHRAEIFKEWIENKNEFFSPENLNKIESVLGTKWRGELEKMLGRMETGRNRLTSSSDANVNAMYDYLNGGVGAIMFWNTRSAALQTISTVNFINWKDNNVFAASKAFANQPQYWKDFAYIFNSSTLKQRRAGLEIDVSASELTNVFESGKRNPKSVLKYLLAQGFTPTRVADSFAISAGGSTFYRNRINKYIKDGLSNIKAKEKAWEDFQEISEETQQSSRPDLISNQQAGPLGRIILPFQNTPMQMTRLLKKANSDMVNFRGDFKSNISRILYYGAIQNVIFGTLQSGLAWGMFGDDREEVFNKKSIKVLNGAFDTIMRGTGIYGAAFTTLKNTYMQWRAQRKKDYGRREDWRIAVEMANFSPPIGSKFRKVMNAIKTEEYNRGVSEELGFRIENPNVYAVASAVEGLTNFPLARAINKANNIEEALTGNHETWQRTAMIMGWSKWSVGVKDEELEVAKAIAKVKRKEENKKQAEIKKEQKKKEKEEENKKKGIKTVRCSGKKSNGKRCGLTTETADKAWKCFHHATFTDGSDRDNDGKKEYRCIGKTKSGRRCSNKGEYGKARKCYAHK